MLYRHYKYHEIDDNVLGVNTLCINIILFIQFERFPSNVLDIGSLKVIHSLTNIKRYELKSLNSQKMKCIMVTNTQE